MINENQRGLLGGGSVVESMNIWLHDKNDNKHARLHCPTPLQLLSGGRVLPQPPRPLCWQHLSHDNYAAETNEDHKKSESAVLTTLAVHPGFPQCLHPHVLMTLDMG